MTPGHRVTASTDQEEQSLVLLSASVMFRKTFAKLISMTHPSLRVIAEPVPEHRETITFDRQPVLVFCDVSGVDLAEMQSLIARLRPGVATGRVAIIIDEVDDALVEAALSAGAQGVMIKAAPPSVLARSLEALLAGERVRPAPTITLDIDALNPALRERLSARRQKLLRLLLGGNSVSSIAGELGMTEAKVIAESRDIMKLVRGQ